MQFPILIQLKTVCHYPFPLLSVIWKIIYTAFFHFGLLMYFPLSKKVSTIQSEISTSRSINWLKFPIQWSFFKFTLEEKKVLSYLYVNYHSELFNKKHQIQSVLRLYMNYCIRKNTILAQCCQFITQSSLKFNSI